MDNGCCLHQEVLQPLPNNTQWVGVLVVLLLGPQAPSFHWHFPFRVSASLGSHTFLAGHPVRRFKSCSWRLENEGRRRRVVRRSLHQRLETSESHSCQGAAGPLPQDKQPRWQHRYCTLTFVAVSEKPLLARMGVPSVLAASGHAQNNYLHPHVSTSTDLQMG